MDSAMSRRGFMAGTSALVGAAALAGTAQVAKADERPWWMPEWDEQTDVVVAGFGASGVAAAIAAREAGLEVVVLEKSPLEDGGNLGCATCNLHTAMAVSDPTSFVANVKARAMGCLPDETVVDTLFDEMMQLHDWMDGFGFSFYEAPGDTETNFVYRTEDGRPGAGVDFFAALARVAHDKGADVRTSSPLTDLVQDPQTKEVLGAVYVDASGATRYLKARQGVIVCTGGYENSPEMQMNYNHAGIFGYPEGTPYNTGDGIRICQKHGADLWHMTGQQWAVSCFKRPSEEIGCAVNMNEAGQDHIDPFNRSYIWVNGKGQRFMDEGLNLCYNADNCAYAQWTWDGYTNLPCWMVFDARVFDNVPLYQGTGYWGMDVSYAGVQKMLAWDNAAALDKGWIVKADTLEELASAMVSTDPMGHEVTVDGEGLAAEVKHWNEMAAAGTDGDFGRWSPMGLSEEGPYYAIEIAPSVIVTEGGPRRDGMCRTLDLDGAPIPRLYSCGECGSINTSAYLMGNILEALANGRMAVRDAASLDPQA